MMWSVPGRHRSTTTRQRRPVDPWPSTWPARTAELTAARNANAAVAPMQIGLESPFPHDHQLNAIVWADLVGKEFDQLTRAGAMSIPALARQRHLLCGMTARCPLVVMNGATALPEPAPGETRGAGHQPTWPTRGDGPLSWWHRMLWTTDDLLFTGWSLWRAGRGFDAGVGTPPLLTTERIPLDRWEVDTITGFIKIDGEVASSDDVILIPGPHEGILNFGGGALRRMIDNLDAAASAARNPSAYLELHYDGDEPLTDDQILDLRVKWGEARTGLYGGVAFTGKNLTVIEHGTHESALLIEGRNADAVDASRLVSSPAAMADATNAGASLTYETSAGRNGQFIDYGVGLYMDAIAARLSMDDVVSRGLRTAFDVTQLTIAAPATTGAPTVD